MNAAGAPPYGGGGGLRRVGRFMPYGGGKPAPEKNS